MRERRRQIRPDVRLDIPIKGPEAVTEAKREAGLLSRAQPLAGVDDRDAQTGGGLARLDDWAAELEQLAVGQETAALNP